MFLKVLVVRTPKKLNVASAIASASPIVPITRTGLNIFGKMFKHNN